MTEKGLVVAVYANHETAEAAVQELQQAGFDMKKLSIVGKDYHTEEHVIGYYNAGDRMKCWGKLGAFRAARKRLLRPTPKIPKWQRVTPAIPAWQATCKYLSGQ